ncbi:MAG: ATP-dependent helicase [Chloroflexota bacterium]
MTHPAVTALLDRLDAAQRRAATVPSGPVLCVAPAGSGKTSTLVARVAWLIDGGAAPESICAITFNKRAAEELRERVAAALAPLGDGQATRVRIRTFHALGLEMLRDAGQAIQPLLDRDEILRAVRPDASLAERRRLDTILSRFKLDLDIDPEVIAGDPEAGPVARTYAAYEAEIRRRGGLDFDDLVARALRLLERDASALAAWRGRCRDILVDESQDLDRAQLRLATLLAAPANRIFLVGDDDQSIYGWRLADVRRLLGLAETALPGLRRHDLETNYRCPGIVVERAVRLVEHNSERFAKVIRSRPEAPGRLILAPSAADIDALDTCTALLRSWPADGTTRAILARTNRELIPAVAACLDLDIPFRARDLELPVESPRMDELIASAAHQNPQMPLLARLVRARHGAPRELDEVAGALLAWAPRYPDLASLTAAIADVRARLARLRRDDAPLSLATVHGTKGLEFDHVAVIGLDDGRFPSARSVAEAEDPARALQEERRLAYVAWTRARRSLTLSYDPAAPSQFLREAFDPEELRAVA